MVVYSAAPILKCHLLCPSGKCACKRELHCTNPQHPELVAIITGTDHREILSLACPFIKNGKNAQPFWSNKGFRSKDWNTQDPSREIPVQISSAFTFASP